MELKGSKTEQALLAAFAGESQARNRYTFFASVAKKAGFEQISAIYTETAINEKEHAELFFKYLTGGNATITATYPAGIIGTVAQNLLASANGEKEEWGKLYPDFAKIADSEGFKDIANTFRLVAKVEAYHERRFRKLLANVENNTVFTKPEKVAWKCSNCGNVMEGLAGAPQECPVCKHPQAYFEVWIENY